MVNICKTTAAVASFQNLDTKKTSNVGENYCMRYQSKWSTALKWGGRVVGVVGIFVAGLFSGGTAFAILFIAAAANTATEIQADYNPTWPSSGGGG
jgi:hypothetical protein